MFGTTWPRRLPDVYNLHASVDVHSEPWALISDLATGDAFKTVIICTYRHNALIARRESVFGGRYSALDNVRLHE